MGNLPPGTLRQPPPPGRHLIEANNEEGNAMMKGKNNNSNNYSRPNYYYSRRCKRIKPTNIDNLPDDLLFNILSHLPAQDIYDLSMLVCWKWYRMIHTHNFIHTHLERSTLGLLIQPAGKVEHANFVTMREGQFEISKLNYKFQSQAQTSSNGLVLGYEYQNPFSYYIVNPATKQHFTLPPFSEEISNRRRCGIAYAASSMEYKVVLHYINDYSEPSDEGQLHIVTVGVDESWRVINTQHLSSKVNKVMFFAEPLITEGFMHWGNRCQVLTLNVETEVLTDTCVPITPQDAFFYMSTGRYLSLLVACGGYSWQVWEMKPESGEWRKMPGIDLEAQKWRFEQKVESLSPEAWLNYPDVLVFWIRANETYTFYNLRTHEIYNGLVGLPTKFGFQFIVHKESLEWLTPGS